MAVMDTYSNGTQHGASHRGLTVPGIGPIISSAMVAAIGNGSAFSRGQLVEGLPDLAVQGSQGEAGDL
jgi:hypothetical protein